MRKLDPGPCSARRFRERARGSWQRAAHCPDHANLNVDPLFVSANDRHLQPGSPVLDKGRAGVQPNESSTDLDGAARLIGPATDMGAYERS
jgi:hypothetical protein